MIPCQNIETVRHASRICPSISSRLRKNQVIHVSRKIKLKFTDVSLFPALNQLLGLGNTSNDPNTVHEEDH